jgi:NADH-quinone oxidoreductase subunit J
VIVTQVEIVFWFFAGSSILSAALCITRKSPVASALWLVGTMFSLAAIFLLLDAQFIAAIQILVYAGAIMVLFLFVIMLLNLGRSGPKDMLGWAGTLVMLAVAGLLGLELWVLRGVAPADELVLAAESVARIAEEQGAVAMMSEPLFHGFLLPFELTGMLLLAAIVGAVVLAKRRL